MFETDPVINFMLCSMSEEERLAYLPDFFKALLTAAALNDASFEEVSSWECSGVMMKPGRRADTWYTLIPAGMIGMIWTLGLGGVRVSFERFVCRDWICWFHLSLDTLLKSG